MSATIPFEIPAQFQDRLASGMIEQVGALLKDAGTGKIVGHLQETGSMQKTVTGMLGGPVFGGIGLGLDVIDTATNVTAAIAANKKLNALTDMVGKLQTLQNVTAAASILGIGVTVASAAVILKRLKTVSDNVKQTSEKVDALPQAWRELDLLKTLGDVQTQLERLEEIETRKAARPIFETAEEKLHTAFNRLHHGAQALVVQKEVNGPLLSELLNGIALSGGAQIRALYELDEVATAETRARRQITKLQELSLKVPRDTLVAQLGNDEAQAQRVSGALSHIRRNTASQPSLAARITELQIKGPDYLARARDEAEEPLLLLPME